MTKYVVRIVLVATAVAFCCGASRSAAEALQYSYDSLQRLTSAMQPDGTTIDYVYDALGNRLMKTTALPGGPSNQPPAAVTNPSPGGESTNFPTSTGTLRWSPAADPDSGDSVVYFIYFGTSPTPPLVFSGWTTNWVPGKLRGWTTYYWQVVARDSHNAQTASPVWSFRTASEPPVADFAASSTNGSAPLTVTFTDRSFDTDNAIVSWQWDFDNNGTVDSTNRNPTMTYTTPGDYTVSLTVRDESQIPTTLVKTNCIHVVGSGIVDLAPLGLSVQSAGSYRQLTVAYSITNRGTVFLSGLWQWADVCYISTNAVLDAQAIQIGIFYESQTLPAGAIYTRTNVVSIPYVPAENYYLLLKADGQNQIAELSEGNNVIAMPLTKTLPDLVVGGLAFSAIPVAGQTLQVTYWVTNRGQLAINADWYDAFYLSTNATWDAQDTPLGQAQVVLALQPGAGCLRTNAVALAPWPPGNYYLILRTDDYDRIVESNETNNVTSIPISLRVPDLAPIAVMPVQTNIEFYPPSSQSPTAVVSWAVINQGTGAASSDWYDRVYVSTNASISGAISSQYFYEGWSSSSLAVGGVYRRTNSVALPQQSGTFWLIFKANDYYGSRYLYEGNQNNNVMAAAVPVTLTYEVRPPDLAPVSLSAPLAAVPGQSISVSYGVTNLGMNPAVGSWYDFVYFSRSGVLDGTEALVSYGWEYESLLAGGSYWRTNTVTLPSWSGGSYYLILKTDAYNYVSESNESNNQSLPVPITLGSPDVVAAILGCDGRVRISPAPPKTAGPVTIYYYPSGGPLAGAGFVSVHLGWNLWQSVVAPDAAMNFNSASNRWEYTVVTPSNATKLDCAFNNGSGVWDHNSGADWHFAVFTDNPTVQVVTNISYLRTLQDPVMWLPTDTITLFQVEGIVTTYTNVTTPDNSLFYMQDQTAGIPVFVSGGSSIRPNAGDRVRVVGPLGTFNSLLEMNLALSSPWHSVTTLSTGNPLPAATLFSDFSLTNNLPAIEALEGSLITIPNAYISNAPGSVFTAGANYTITNASGQPLILRADARVGDIIGKPIPSVASRITGVLGQFLSTSATDRTAGYQILPTRYIDISTNAVPSAITMTGTRMLSNGVFQIAFTNTPGATFSLLGTTNMSLPLSNWAVLGAVTEVSPSQFQCNGPQATNSPQRFYRVRSP